MNAISLLLAAVLAAGSVGDLQPPGESPPPAAVKGLSRRETSWLKEFAHPGPVQPAYQIAYSDSPLIAGVEFSPDGATLYVLSTPTRTNLWAACLHFWPELIDALAAGVVVPSSIWLVRRLRLSQTRGRLYCRHCNYDLGSVEERRQPDQPETPICTECGAALKPRDLLPGRSAWGRGTLPGAIVAIALLASVAPWTLNWPRDGWLTRAVVWEWPWLEAQITSGGRDPLKNFRGTICRVDEYDSATGKLRRTLRERPGYPSHGLSISPDGTTLFVRYQGLGRFGDLDALDARTGRVIASLDVTGSSVSQNDRALVACDPLASIAYVADSTSTKSRLRAWNYRTGEVNTPIEEPGFVPKSGMVEPRRYLLFFKPEGTRVFSYPGFIQIYQGNQRATRLYDLEGRVLSEGLAPQGFAPTADPVVCEEKSLVFASDMLSGIAALDPFSGEQSFLGKPGDDSGWDNLGISRDGHFLAWPLTLAGGIVIRDIAHRRWHAFVAHPVEWIAPRHLTFSPDGRLFAGVPFTSNGAANHRVFVYRLSTDSPQEPAS